MLCLVKILCRYIAPHTLCLSSHLNRLGDLYFFVRPRIDFGKVRTVEIVPIKVIVKEAIAEGQVYWLKRLVIYYGNPFFIIHLLPIVGCLIKAKLVLLLIINVYYWDISARGFLIRFHQWASLMGRGYYISSWDLFILYLVRLTINTLMFLELFKDIVKELIF